MKKIILILIALTTFINVSYASFPMASIVDTPTTDTILNIETIEQYHLRMQKMGFDLSSCKCESCRSGMRPLVRNSKGELVKVDNGSESNAKAMYLLAGLILLGVIIWGFIGLTRAYNCVDNRSDCPQSSGEKPKSGAPVGLLLGSALIVISLVIAIKARIMQLKNKN
ncbi:MAG: hypothetical protein H8E84_03220 [Flavobacteriales bacterium]|nr:hypothetical protein [Flavobacteriales bacterium]